MSKKSMQFLFGDRELVITAKNLLETSADVIVNPTDSDLSHEFGLSAQIKQQSGEQLIKESNLLLDQYTTIDCGMAVYTGAGLLPYEAVIHIVGPKMGEENEQQKIEQVIARCLQLCEINEWRSIAFPAIGAGGSGVPVGLVAQAFFRSITHFWDARHECVIEKIEICLTDKKLMSFFEAFREDSLDQSEGENVELQEEVDDEENIGIVDLSENDIADADSDEINDWFK